MAEEIQIKQVREKLEEINPLVKPYQLAYVHVLYDCVPIEKNAHYMDKDVFDKLTSNIKEDGFLSQLPFAMKRGDGKYIILSGNHRLKAAIKAGLKYIMVLYIDEVSKDKMLSYQLSHNSLVGKDDVAILKELFDEIESIKYKEFSGLSDLQFLDNNTFQIPSINDSDIEITEMKFLFFESKKNEIMQVLDFLEHQEIDENSRIVYGSFMDFIKVATSIKVKYDIKSNSVAFSKMIDICSEHIKQLEK